MESTTPRSDDAARRAGASCPSCRAATAADQRYCLACGALVDDRRLDPIAMLTPADDPARVGGSPSGPATAAPRAVPLAAATAAIVVAGISGMLVTQGGSGTGARAAVVAAAPAPDPAAAGSSEGAASAPSSDASARPPADDPQPTDPLPADPLPADPLPADEPAPVESEAPADTPADDADTSQDDDAEDASAPAVTPRVWLLALEGPRAAEAVERVAEQGVRLSGMQAVAAAAQPNATALVSGTRPAADVAAPAAGTADPAAASGAAGPSSPTTTGTGDEGTGTAPSLPRALLAAKRTWRAYVDVQPTSGSVLPGACAAPAAGDPAAASLAARLPFAAIDGIDCDRAVTSLEALGNDLSAGEDIPAFSYVAMGGCAAPERPVVALPDAVEDAVTTITESTEYQQDGMLVVTAIGTQDTCMPGASDGPAAPAVSPAAPIVAEAPTVVLRPAVAPGKTVKTTLDLLTLSRAMAEVLGVTPPGAAGDDAVPALALPGVPKKT